MTELTMPTSEVFDRRRFLAMLRLEWAMRRRAWLFWVLPLPVLYGVAGLFGFLVKAPTSNGETALSLALALGVLHATGAFADLHARADATSYLLIPASTLEKALVRFLLGALAFPAAVAALIFLGSALFSGLAFLSGSEHAHWNLLPLWRTSTLGTFGLYLFFHSMAFCGSIWFRPPAGVKTALFVAGYCVFSFLVVMLLVVATRVMFSVELSNDWFRLTQSLVHIHSGSWTGFVNGLSRTLLPVVLYLAAFLKLREAEVK